MAYKPKYGKKQTKVYTECPDFKADSWGLRRIFTLDDVTTYNCENWSTCAHFNSLKCRQIERHKRNR